MNLLACRYDVLGATTIDADPKWTHLANETYQVPDGPLELLKAKIDVEKRRALFAEHYGRSARVTIEEKLMKTNLQIVAEAALNKKPLELVYDGKRRRVEPHALGVTKDFNLVTRVYQTAPEPAWRMLMIDGISQAEIMLEGEGFEPRVAEGYKVGDRGMATIILQQLPGA